jgi:hypothetical protein
VVAGRALAVVGTPGCGACATAGPPVFEMHVFSLSGGAADDELEDGVSACTQWSLPCPEFQGLWGSLVYDSDLKGDLLEYIRTAMLFAQSGVDETIVGCNRIVLLHGPPGTGKVRLVFFFFFFFFFFLLLTIYDMM